MLKHSRRLSLALALMILLSGIFAPIQDGKTEEAAPPASTAAIDPAAETTAEPEAQEQEGNFFASLKLNYINGEPFDASVFDGKPILLNIWATWCQPCVSEMPHLNELAAEYADRLNIVGLHSEGLTVTAEGELAPNEEANQAAVEMAESLSLTFPLVNPDTNLFILMNDPNYGLQTEFLPTTWLIDGDGFVRGVLTSARDKEAWKQVIEEFLTKLREEADAEADT